MNDNSFCSEQGGDIRSQPRFAIRDASGTTRVVIEAANAEMARLRVRQLHDVVPRLPGEFTVESHVGPIRSAWFGGAWFQLRDDIERLADGELDPSTM